MCNCVTDFPNASRNITKLNNYGTEGAMDCTKEINNEKNGKCINEMRIQGASLRQKYKQQAIDLEFLTKNHGQDFRKCALA